MLSARKVGAAVLAVFASSAVAAEPLRLVVMDPLSKPLSCPCVEGYAQRDYAALAEFLEERLGREVTVAWNGSLVSATEQAGRPADVAIGKHSVVAADAVRLGRAMSPVASLTGQDGAVTQRGLIVVRSGDAATELADLAGYRVFFGPEDEAEKSAAAVCLLATVGIDPPDKPERFGACSEAAVKLLEQPAGTDACAVISSYAAPLLEGCGSVKKGDLRVLAETEQVPFVSAFVADDLDPELRDTVTKALLETATRAELLVALETLIGFVPFEPVPTSGDSSADAGTGTDAEKADRQVSTLGPESWPQFRGPNRDGVVPGLPDRLPRTDEAVWEVELPGEGLGGLAVADGVLVLGGRDATDRDDLFRAYDAATGLLLWEHAYRAEGRLDYGNAPRATPLIESGLVVTVGAFGRVCCLDLVTGVPLWERDLVADFGGSMPAWGYSASPLLTGTAVVVEPGHPDAAVVALDLVTGAEVWRSPGGKAVYTSPLVLTAGGDTRIFGRDGVGPIGRDPATGRATWRRPAGPREDFGVPSPVATARGLLYASETDGLRLFDAADGPAARADVTLPFRASDSHTPVAVGDRLFVADGRFRLFGLDLADGLRTVWTVKDRALKGHVSVIADAPGDRLLLLARDGELILVDDAATAGKITDRVTLAAGTGTPYAHPAIVGDLLYTRVGRRLACYRLGSAT